MSATRGDESGSVRPVAALAYACIGFATLLIFGFGMLSLALNADVLPVPGLGNSPGIVGVIVALAGFAAALWRGLRAERPTYWTAAIAAVISLVVYLAAVWLTALFTGARLGLATSAVAAFATSWFAAVLLASAAIAAWSGIALVRTRAARPKWPWEDEEDE
jgi:hypothetical protein